jgi:chorismate-pyruvate lyase
MRQRVAAVLAVAGFYLSAMPCIADSLWPNNAVNRWQALALIESLNGEILASPSATTSLEKWCGEHQLAPVPKLVADAVTDAAPRPVSAEQRRRLGVGPDEPVNYRHLRLRCGTHVLSEADNWYVPSRLTLEMNRALETSDAPFGRVVRPLEPYRRTFVAKILWSPLSAPTTAAALDVPKELFEHRAILYTKDHLPFSEVDEIYQRDALDFPPTESK